MKKPRLTTASTVVVLLFVLSGHEAVCKSRGHFSGVGFDFATGGYHDVAVIVSPELSRAECPQILDDVKVGAEKRTLPFIVTVSKRNWEQNCHSNRLSRHSRLHAVSYVVYGFISTCCYQFPGKRVFYPTSYYLFLYRYSTEGVVVPYLKNPYKRDEISTLYVLIYYDFTLHP